MANYIVTYTPLAASREGMNAVERYGHPPYADASCRREPDFEAVYPSITCVCRGANFAPRIRRGDTVAYLTKKDAYPGLRTRHWRLVAVLRVIEVFATHEAAARWHRERGLPLPSDCLVSGNHPLPLDHTNGPDEDLVEWDGKYQERVAANGAIAICEPLWMDLYAPPVVTDAIMLRVFGRSPPTRNPPSIPDSEIQALLTAVGVTADGSHVHRPKKPVRPNVPGQPRGKSPSGGSSGGCGGGSSGGSRTCGPRGRCG